MKKLVLIDGHHLIFRAFYAIQNMRTRDGRPSNAVFGFASMLLNIISLEKPDYLAVAFDMGKTFRHEEHAEYKAQRKERPQDLDVQIPEVQTMVQRMEIPSFTAEGFEADDILATIAVRALRSKDLEVIIVSGDKDLYQLVNHRIRVAIPNSGHNAPVYINSDEVVKKLGVGPEQVPDYKAMVGDPSDNFKGVSGLGPKNASLLLQAYGTLENIYEHINEIKGALKDKLIADKESAFFCKRMAQLIKDVPLDYTMEKIRFSGISEEVIPFFKDMDFNSLQKRIEPYLIVNEKDIKKDIGYNEQEKRHEDNTKSGNRNTKEKKKYNKENEDQMSLFTFSKELFK